MKHKLIYISIILIVLAGIAFALNAKEKELYSSLAVASLNKVSQTVSGVLNDQLSSIRESLTEIGYELGKNKTLCRNPQSESEKIKDKVDIFLEIDSSNKVACSSNQSLIGIDALDLEGFEKFINDPNHYPRLSHIFSVNDSAKMIAGYVPVYDDKQKYIGAVSGLTYVSNLGRHTPRPALFKNTDFATLFDDNGDVIFDSDKNMIGKNITSDEVRQIFGINQEVSEAFAKAAEGNASERVLVFNQNNKKYIGKFTPLAVGPNHIVVIFSYLPSF